jgi:hypothetical protein
MQKKYVYAPGGPEDMVPRADRVPSWIKPPTELRAVFFLSKKYIWDIHQSHGFLIHQSRGFLYVSMVDEWDNKGLLSFLKGVSINSLD